MSVESSPGFSEQATLFTLLGIIIDIPILVVYMATCVSVPFFYRRVRSTWRNESNFMLVESPGGWYPVPPGGQLRNGKRFVLRRFISVLCIL